jgi:hypothetical protein
MEIEGSTLDAIIKLSLTMAVEDQVTKGHQFG